MRYSMTFVSDDYEKLTAHLFEDSSVEQAAYLLCGISQTQSEIRFLVRTVVLVSPDTLKEQSDKHLSIPSSSFVPVLKQAADRQECFFLVHSHPPGFEDFSSQDDLEEPKLFRTAYIRVGFGIHGSLVFSGRDTLSGRVWIDDGDELRPIPLNLIRIIGRRYEFLIPANGPAPQTVMPKRFFERQIRAFGKDLQRLLENLHIGVVGCGGTGSAVLEQLARLGVGQMTIVDPDKVEDTNISRIHGSGLYDKGRSKVQVMEDMIKQIGFGTRVHVIEKKVIYESVARDLRNCDLIFGCTDDQAGRMVLNELSIHYYIPLIDMGVVIDSHLGYLRSVLGRVTIVRPKANCLLCRQWIRMDLVAAELMAAELREQRVKEGYAPELEEKDPAVVSFTTAVATQSVMEMLHLITGYMGDERDVRDILWRLDSTAYSFRPVPNSEGCSCTTYKKVGRGDRRQFLGMLFMAEPECEV
ncbi:HesA/MoeB/ThiF family protein [Alicyclobacillus hesperidum]|uniref:JAB domain-containing protein n=1 Tax=Alicyclobacillus hesperidum TaxID=89784 RepID=A0A1H2X665_9BACL|nr:ThiF family adenylyltransferase [Alicyclobacillus hesperidum]SDW88291.1 JAB domain-containing protein [Alicyclobacillus hesperidum]